MTLEALYFIAQIIAAISIVGSLIFVGLQMRRQARETAMQRLEQRIAQTASMRTALFDYPDLRRVILKANEEGLAALSQEEFMLHASWGRRLMILTQLAHEGARGTPGGRPPRDVLVSTAHAFAMPSMREFWELVRPEYEPEFVAFIEDLLAWAKEEGFNETPYQKLHPEFSFESAPDNG